MNHHHDLFWDSEFANVECHVGFAPGTEYRKQTCSVWLILEEHSIAIAATHIAGFRDGQILLDCQLVPHYITLPLLCVSLRRIQDYRVSFVDCFNK
jgi:hypothetical protein